MNEFLWADGDAICTGTTPYVSSFFLNAEKVRLEEGVPAAVPRGLRKLAGTRKSGCQGLKPGRRNKVSGKNDFRRRRVRLVRQSYFKRATGDSARSRFAVMGRNRGIPVCMVAVAHVRHQSRLTAAGQSPAYRGRNNPRRGKNRLGTACDADERRHPERNGGGEACFECGRN